MVAEVRWGGRRKNGVGGVDCLTWFLYNWGLGFCLFGPELGLRIWFYR